MEESDGVSALVLELVEGQTLADRLERGPLPLPQALAIARQIAEALDAAHEKGIVHRDLKPANIVLQGAPDRLSADVRAKVLDFGLAKPMAIDGAAAPTQGPSDSFGGTADGRILGTPAYMSPEQARGLTVDKRTDIWAFGCVLFEMLAGRRTFEGATITDTLARILDREPDWNALPADTPAPIRTLLERCLRKDSKRRLHDVADALIETRRQQPRARTVRRYWRWLRSTCRATWRTSAACVDRRGGVVDHCVGCDRTASPRGAACRQPHRVRHRSAGESVPKGGVAQLRNLARQSAHHGCRADAGRTQSLDSKSCRAAMAPTSGH